MNILGISAFYHDSAACLMQDGKITACAQEERFSRIKHDHSYPAHAIEYCLKAGKISPAELDYVGFYEKPFIKFERILLSHLAGFPRSFPSFLTAVPVWLKEKLWIPHKIRKELGMEKEILMIEHHLSHAASSFLVSPFSKAAILTVDGVGEWATAAYGIGDENKIELLKEQRFPHSVGLLYSAFTYYLGFEVNSDEYKVMGLAPYGSPVYSDLILSELLDLKPDGSFQLNMKYFPFDCGLEMINPRLEALFGHRRRLAAEPLEKKHQDLAASIQKVTEIILLQMARHLHKETGLENLCLAGGVALNSVANGKILRQTDFKEIFIQPAAGDAGGAVGVAAYIHNSILNRPRDFRWEHAYWGPEFTETEIERFLKDRKLPFRKVSEKELLETSAGLLAQKKVIGWFAGRMEFGPRALGNRSILADPRSPEMKEIVNRKIKFREEFRPFAPAVLEERAGEFFELDRASPYMLLVAPVKPDKRDEIPSVTHVDGSARIQTVNEKQNRLFYNLLKEFEAQTRCPMLLNTSFNLKGEPMVSSPADAYGTFIRSGLDYLMLGNFILDKTVMPERDLFSEMKGLPAVDKTVTIR